MQIGSSTSSFSPSSFSTSSLVAASEINAQPLSALAAVSQSSGNSGRPSSSFDNQALTQTQNAPTANGQRGGLLNILV
jgi:hypothetical protein